MGSKANSPVFAPLGFYQEWQRFTQGHQSTNPSVECLDGTKGCEGTQNLSSRIIEQIINSYVYENPFTGIVIQTNNKVHINCPMRGKMPWVHLFTQTWVNLISLLLLFFISHFLEWDGLFCINKLGQ